MAPPPQRILIVGTGAIGAFFASRLSTISGLKISTICRSNFNAIKSHGIRVTSPIFKDYTFKPEYTFSSAEEARKVRDATEGLRWDFLLVSTKVLPEEVVGDPGELVDGLVDGESSLVVCQNGLGVEEAYWRRFGGRKKNAIVSMVTRTSVTQESLGHVVHKHWTKTTIGPYAPDASAAVSENAIKKTAEFASLLQQAGIPDVDVLTHTGMQFARWHKTAINAALNPSAVLAGGLTNQALALDDALLTHQVGVMQEILDAATKVLGAPLPDTLPKIEDVFQGVKEDVSGSKASMLNDWEAGRPVEIEAILGNPIRQAEARGIVLPRTQTLYALLKSAQRMRSG